MKNSSKLNLKLTDDFIDDGIQETIEGFSRNFEILDDKYKESISSTDFLVEGSYHERGKIYYNSDPLVNNYVGWVNINEGMHTAKKWGQRVEYKFGDLIEPTERNGYIYRCVVEGTSAYNEPSFPTTRGVRVDDLYLVQEWRPAHNYNLGDIVTNAEDQSVYYECITEGLSGDQEPNWGTIIGTTVIDKSVVWLVHKTVRWQNFGSASEFRPFGKIE